MDKEQGAETVVEEVVQTPEERQAEEAEGEAAFAAGVAKTTGTPEKPDAKTVEKTDDTKLAAEAAAKATADAEAKAKADEAAKAAAKAQAEPWRGEFDKLNTSVSSQLRNLAGHIGSFKQALDKISSTAAAAAEKKGLDAPTKIEIAEALNDPDKWKQLQDDFPEWMQPVAAELTRLRKDMASVAKAAQERPAPVAAPAAKAEPVDTTAVAAQAEERAYVRLKHPDWKAICATAEFHRDWLPKQSDELKAKAASESGDDAVAVFDAYKAHQKKLVDEKAAKDRNEQRLLNAVPAKGSAEPPKAGIDDEEAFNAGVKKTLRKAL